MLKMYALLSLFLRSLGFFCIPNISKHFAGETLFEASMFLGFLVFPCSKLLLDEHKAMYAVFCSPRGLRKKIFTLYLFIFNYALSLLYSLGLFLPPKIEGHNKWTAWKSTIAMFDNHHHHHKDNVVVSGPVSLHISRPWWGGHRGDVERGQQPDRRWSSFVVGWICAKWLLSPQNDGCKKKVPNLDSPVSRAEFKHSTGTRLTFRRLAVRCGVTLKRQQPTGRWERVDPVQRRVPAKKSPNPVALLRRWILINIGLPSRLTDGPTVARVSAPAA